ncbi:hypothetical protein K466DRAFT_662833 [Polyporus arcularius HHB13444]|uniref:Uncharacterized protein n=1 Tax=Polyporus arcularius HHB13444 TaxID=1314778 RepID=A0A5C3PD69_9APHY|nr:hypothetical protein K466DRAFT_662833 [Polyporus arcularius HHB13444]
MSTGHAPLPGGTPPSGLSEAAPPPAEPPESQKTLGTSNGLPPDLSQRPAIVPGREVTGDADAHCYITIQPPSPPPPPLPQRFEGPFLAAATAGDELRIRPCDNWDTSIALKDVLEQLRREGFIKNVQSTEREELRQWQAVGQWRVPFLFFVSAFSPHANSVATRGDLLAFSAQKLDQNYVRPTNAQTAAGSDAGPAATPGRKTLDRPEQFEAHANGAGNSIAETKFKRPNRKPPKNATDVRQTPAALQRARAQSTSADASQRTPSTDAHPDHAFRPHASALPHPRLPPTLQRSLQFPRPTSESTSTSTNSSPNSSSCSTISDHTPLGVLRPPASPPIPLQSMPYPRPPGAGQQSEFKFKFGCASQGASSSSSTVTSDPKPHDSRGPEPAKMVFVGARSQAQQAPPRKKPGARPARKRKDKDKDKAKAAPGPSTSRG